MHLDGISQKLHNGLILADRTATQHDRLLASCWLSAVCPSVMLYILALRVSVECRGLKVVGLPVYSYTASCSLLQTLLM